MLACGLFVSAFLTALAVEAAPRPALEARQSTAALDAAQTAAFKPYSFYAGAAACQASSTLTWTCGANCDANPSFQPIASGGDGDQTQFWYVGFDPILSTVIVAHQGTNTSELLPILTDLNFFPDELDPTLFPGISTSIKVHNGFSESHARSATAVLSAVQTALSTHGANHVTVVGFSLGAALALLDSVYLPLHLPASTNFTTIGYGLPRVGNQAFADYVDAHVTNLSRVNNQKDVIPILPGRFLGFHHPSGEKHIQASGVWIACSGQDNTNEKCTDGEVSSVFEGQLDDHSGPYDGVYLRC